MNPRTGVLKEHSPARARLASDASRLRKKLSVAEGDRYIVNVWGVGYRLLE